MGLASSSDVRLSPQELRMVQDSWKVVMENPEANGTVILKTFLERHNYYSKFDKFKGIPVSELPNNRTFRNHALAIIKTIDQVTQNINNEEIMKSVLIKLGRSHKARKITPKQFDELKIVILDVLRGAFGLSREAITAWTKTFDIAYSYVFQALREES